MKNKRFIALGDLIADCYYNEKKLLGIDGGSSRFNVIANLSHMNCQSAIIGGCGNDKIGNTIIKRLSRIGVDTSKIFLRDRATRAYHLTINKDTLPKITYQCSKNSPQNGKSTWYEDSLDNIQYFSKEVKDTDVVVLDNLDELSLSVINQFQCDKVLDIGNTNQLEKLEKSKVDSLKNKIEILQLNERVVPYLINRFGITNVFDIYNFFQPKLMIVTHAKDGADFVFENTEYNKKLLNSAKELDATGAGDAFLSVFVKNYYDNHKNVDKEFIDNTFEQAINLTSKVVQNVGARGHIYEKVLDKSFRYKPLQKVGTREYVQEKIDENIEK